MKLLKLFGGTEIPVSEEDAEKLNKVLFSGREGLILLSSGDTINPKGIASITAIPKRQYYNGQPVVNGEYIHGAGERYFLELEDRKDIKWCYDPKYFGGQLLEAKRFERLPEVSEFAKMLPVKGMSGSKTNQNPNAVLSKENNWGKGIKVDLTKV